MSGRAPARRRWLKASLIALAALCLAIIGAAAAFVLGFDANRWKPRIAATVEAATGRQIALNGPIGLKLSLRPTIEARDVAIANPPGFSRPEMAKIGALDLQLDLLALLRGNYLFDRLLVAAPDVLFERNAAGATNWVFAAASAAARGPRNSSIEVRNFAVRGGRAAFRDDRTGKTTVVAIEDLDIDATEPGAAMRFSAKMEVGNTPVTASAETGPLERLVAGAAGAPVPLKARFEAGGATLALDGSVGDPLAGLGYRLQVSGTIPDLAALSDLAGATLPSLRQIALSARFAPTARLAEAWQGGLTLEDVKLTSAQGDLSGRATFRLGERPGVTAELSSTRLDLDALLPAAPSPASGRFFPDTALPIEALRRLDLDLRFLFGDVVFGSQHWREAGGRIALSGGKLRLDPFAVTAPGGKLSLSLTADASGPTPNFALSLRAPAYSLAALLAAAGSPVAASGAVSITADLRGEGASPHAIAAGLDGTLVAGMNGGRIDDRALGGGLGKILSAADPSGLLGGARAGDIRCMTLRLAARNGIAALSPFVLVTSLASIEGSGSLALGPETMNLVLRPHGSIAGKQFSAAVAVRGSFRNPQIVPDAAGTVAGIGGLVGQFAGKNLPIPGLTQTAAPACAGGAPGAAATTPARTVPQLPNPTNVLKNLFR